MKKVKEMKITIWIGIFILLLPLSCVERIELDPPTDLTEAIVIQGRAVLGENSRIEIKTTRLFDFSSESKLALNVKEAIVRDEEGNSMELIPLFQGVFNTPLDENSPIQLKVGGRYSMEITTLDNRTYLSSFDLLTDNSPPRDISFGPAEQLLPNANGNLEIVSQLETFIDTDINESSEGVLWEIDRTYRLTDSPVDGPVKTCYLTSAFSLETIPVFTDSDGVTTSLNKHSLGTQNIDYRFAEGMYITVRQYSLSSGGKDYWNAVSSLAKKEGDLFDEPVGLIPTNFENINDPDDEVFGYFFVTKEESIRLRVPDNLIGEVVLPCPPANPPMGMRACNLGICCDCLEGPNATLERPLFWID
ncbi:MAG: DUF4249 family protein [Saprospiraceae bacterium]|nr:DUF4249 family protein [Saprospiraceae bacterium]|tara:strand:- start:381 stop:1463 length:1083 start_codon:yes stop_codon:yes gene_type:complete